MACIRSALVCCGVLLVAAFSCAGAAFGVENASTDLVLEIWVNGVNANVVTTVTKHDGELWAARSDLVDAGINLNQISSGTAQLIQLSKLQGIAVAIDEPDQRLLVKAQADSLTSHIIDLRRRSLTLDDTAGTGVIASYEMAATSGDFHRVADSSGVQGAFGATLFGPLGALKTTAISQADSLGAVAVRLDTTAEWDEPEVPRRWLFGDGISGGLSWSRLVRFGGIQVGTDFSLQPGFSTAPLPAFFGQSVVPSSVDVFVNSTRVFEGNLDPGPFEIHDLPVVTGSGEATVVVRNALGQETTQTISFYTTDALLQRGLSTYDFDIGFLRQEYGERSFAYGRPLAAGTYRYGLLNWITLEAHSEAAPGAQVAGGGAALSIASYGAIGADAAVSNSAQGRGGLVSTFFESQSRPLSLFGSISATGGRYADLASTDNSPLPRLRTELGTGLSLGQAGSLAASWIETKDASATQLLSASYSLSFAEGWYFGATGMRDFGAGLWAAQLTLSIPVGDHATASISAQSDHHSAGTEGSFTQPVNPDGGWGYNLSASAGEFGGASGETTWIGDHGVVDAAVSSVNGQTAGRLSVTGGLVSMSGATFLTRVPDGAVALAETGKPNIPVYLENRQVATSNADGEALVTGLAPNAANEISVQPMDYSFATVVTKTDRIVVPRRQTGVIVDLAPIRSRPALVTIVREDGTPPPPGSEAVLSTGGPPLIVGHDGQVFFADLEAHTTATVSWSDGACEFALDSLGTIESETIATVGPVRCVRVTASQS